MDLHRILLFVFSSLVSLLGHFRTIAQELVHFKDLVLHYIWLFLHQFLPRRRFILERLPKHVAFSIADFYDDGLGPCVILSDLARLICWCGRYNVEKVSIYDWMGIVADPKTTKKLADLVWTNAKDPDYGLDDFRLSVNGVQYDDQKSDRLLSNGSIRTLDLVTLDWKSGRRAVVQASRSFGLEIKSGRRSLAGSKLGSALNDYLSAEHGVSAPDLLIEFGGSNVGDSTCGYPPLALRVVEIVRIPKHRGIHEITFLECLEKYSQRERRHGK